MSDPVHAAAAPVITTSGYAVRTRRPLQITRWTQSSFDRVMVAVESDGIVGRGEAAPNQYYGETAATVTAILPVVCARVHDLWDWDGLDAAMDAAVPHGHPSARAAITAAVLEWCARSVGLPVWRMLGLSPLPIPATSVTIGLGPPAEMAAAAATARREGHRILKLKLGAPGDATRIETVREAVTDAILRVDANAGWDRRTAVAMLPVLAAHDVELLEQPLAADDLDGHRMLRSRSALPIVADESLHAGTSLSAVGDAFDGVNIKLSKIGGPLRALAMIRAARERHIAVMLGCMVESSLGIAPAVHLGGLVDWVDLDGPLLLEKDPFAGLIWDDAVVQRPHAPGWGLQEPATQGADL